MWSIHRAGCKDIRKDAAQHAGFIEAFEAADHKAALAFQLADINADFIAEGSTPWGPEAVNVLSCAKKVQ